MHTEGANFLQIYKHQIKAKKKSTVIQQEKKSVIHDIYLYIYIYTKTNTGLQKTCQVESPNNPLTGNECQCTIK